MPSFMMNLSLLLRKLVGRECCPFPYPHHALPPTSTHKVCSLNPCISRKSFEVQELLIPSKCFVLEIFKHLGTLKEVYD